MKLMTAFGNAPFFCLTSIGVMLNIARTMLIDEYIFSLMPPLASAFIDAAYTIAVILFSVTMIGGSDE